MSQRTVVYASDWPKPPRDPDRPACLKRLWLWATAPIARWLGTQGVEGENQDPPVDNSPRPDMVGDGKLNGYQEPGVHHV